MLATVRFSVDPHWSIALQFASFLCRRGGRFFAFTPKQQQEHYSTTGSLQVPWFGLEWTSPTHRGPAPRQDKPPLASSAHAAEHAPQAGAEGQPGDCSICSNRGSAAGRCPACGRYSLDWCLQNVGPDTGVRVTLAKEIRSDASGA